MVRAPRRQRLTSGRQCLVLPILCLFLGSVSTLADQAASAEPSAEVLPRYRLEVGQELMYKQTGDKDLLAKKKDETADRTRSEKQVQWHVWPVRQEDDGSWRLLIRKQVKTLRIPAEGEPEVTFENDFLGYCDLQPDGSFAANPSLGGHPFFKVHPDELFVRLPPSAEAFHEGWEYAPPLDLDDEARYTFRLTGHEGDIMTLACTVVRRLDINYQSQESWQVQFDRQRGLVTQLVQESKSDWQTNPWHSRKTIDLVSVERKEPSWVAQFDDEAMRYNDVANQWWARSEEGSQARTKADCQTLLDETRQVITGARDKARVDEARELYDALLALHDREAAWALDDAADRQELYAMPAADWETTDLDGNPRRLVDYRGQVVVLDFWYRGCYHCVKALPKVKKLAALYTGRDAVVLGVNSDQNDDDARYVIDTFGLQYPSLRAGNIGKQYRVHTWPTIVVLDQTGRIADCAEGNSEDLFEHVKGVVDGLLADPVVEPAPRLWLVVTVISLLVVVVVSSALIRRGRSRNAR
jgi:peroxiredoxin